MIASLRGRILDLDRGAGEVVVEAGGVGYRVLVGPATVARLDASGGEVFVWTHHHVREDAQLLYGFPTADERRCFTALLGAHGVGPGLAMAILSVHSPAQLVRLLADDDIDALCLVPGVGKKTAARLLVELKARLDLPLVLDPSPGTAGAGAGAGALEGGERGARADVRDALAALGYGTDEVRPVLADLPEGDDAGALLRDALRRLAAVR